MSEPLSIHTHTHTHTHRDPGIDSHGLPAVGFRYCYKTGPRDREPMGTRERLVTFRSDGKISSTLQSNRITEKSMLRLIVVLTSLLSITAFSPMARVSHSSSLKMGFESEIGAQPPLGFWDPLNLLKDADQARFDRLRYVEVKHGRISMLAILGHLVTTAGYRLPGNISYDLKFAQIPTGLKALEVIPFAGICQIIAFIGLIELGFNSRQEEIEEAQFEASGWDEATFAKKKAIELNNGRAAQMGILGLMVHEKLNNDPYVINSLLGSPVDFNAGF